MKVLIINGSPRGRFSVTLQSCLYLERVFTDCEFEYLNAGSSIHSFERDMSGATEAILSADLVVFAYPVYCFLVPSQLHRFIELLKVSGKDFSKVFVTQLSTSKHFFDVTAHRFIEDNCHDLGMRVIHGLSADAEDLLCERGRSELEDFFKYAGYCVQSKICEPSRAVIKNETREYECRLELTNKADGYDTVIVADLREGDESLRAMIKDFRAAFPYSTRFVNLADFSFKGGCLGCLSCSIGGKCVYKDGFDDFFRDNISNAGAIVYAFTVRDHSMGSCFKAYDDRRFYNGHRTLEEGKCAAYIVNGDMSAEENLCTVLEAKAQVGGYFNAGYATDTEQIITVAKRLAYALEHRYSQPRSFYGVGGLKIFRDLIWLMRGIMKQDHEFYKAKGKYDFPQRRWPTMLGLSALGFFMRLPWLKDKLIPQMNRGMLEPYKRVLNKFEQAQEEAL